MADGSSGGGGGTSVLAFILGGVIVALLVIGFFAYNGGHFGSAQHTANLNVHVSGPTKP